MVFDPQTQAEPGVRHRQTQVHVVGQYGHTFARSPGRHRPGIAADAGDILAPGRRTKYRAGKSIRVGAAQIADIHGGYRQRGQGFADHGGIPGRPGLCQEIEHRRRQSVAQAAKAGLTLGTLVMQTEIHGEHHEHGILGVPSGRLRAQHQVLERPHRQRLDPGVDAPGVGIDDCFLGIARRLHHLARNVTHAMNPLACIVVGGRLSHQSGQLSGRQSTHQVHLEETFLGVHESGRQSAVATTLGVNRHDADLVARDTHRRGEARDGLFTVEPRQAAAHSEPRRHHGDQDEESGKKDKTFQKSHIAGGALMRRDIPDVERVNFHGRALAAYVQRPHGLEVVISAQQ